VSKDSPEHFRARTIWNPTPEEKMAIQDVHTVKNKGVGLRASFSYFKRKTSTLNVRLLLIETLFPI
jgi:hypothetical protein